MSRGNQPPDRSLRFRLVCIHSHQTKLNTRNTKIICRRIQHGFQGCHIDTPWTPSPRTTRNVTARHARPHHCTRGAALSTAICAAHTNVPSSTCATAHSVQHGTASSRRGAQPSPTHPFRAQPAPGPAARAHLVAIGGRRSGCHPLPTRCHAGGRLGSSTAARAGHRHDVALSPRMPRGTVICTRSRTPCSKRRPCLDHLVDLASAASTPARHGCKGNASLQA